MFLKLKRNYIGSPSQILVVIIVIAGIWLFITWQKRKDKEKAKEQIMASAPAKICVNCDTENSVDAKFCKSCGGNQFNKQSTAR
ncbi:MAG: hypothetical protein FWF37_05080 [Chloroflexi bacterium]|nr:hypothetical protein [Chloroflexota bacterium]